MEWKGPLSTTPTNWPKAIPDYSTYPQALSNVCLLFAFVVALREMAPAALTGKYPPS